MTNLAFENSSAITPELLLVGVANLPALEGHNPSGKMAKLLEDDRLSGLGGVMMSYFDRKIGHHSWVRSSATIGALDFILAVHPVVAVTAAQLGPAIANLPLPEGETMPEILEKLRNSSPNPDPFDEAHLAHQKRLESLFQGNHDHQDLISAGSVGFRRIAKIFIEPIAA